MKRAVELDTMDVADRLNVFVDEAEMIAMAVSGMRTLGSLPSRGSDTPGLGHAR